MNEGVKQDTVLPVIDRLKQTREIVEHMQRLCRQLPEDLIQQQDFQWLSDGDPHGNLRLRLHVMREFLTKQIEEEKEHE